MKSGVLAMLSFLLFSQIVQACIPDDCERHPQIASIALLSIVPASFDGATSYLSHQTWLIYNDDASRAGEILFGVTLGFSILLTLNFIIPQTLHQKPIYFIIPTILSNLGGTIANTVSFARGNQTIPVNQASFGMGIGTLLLNILLSTCMLHFPREHTNAPDQHPL